MFQNVEHNSNLSLPSLTSPALFFPSQRVTSWFVFLYIQSSITDLPKALMRICIVFLLMPRLLGSFRKADDLSARTQVGSDTALSQALLGSPVYRTGLQIIATSSPF